MSNIKIHNTTFVESSDLIPDSWGEDFWMLFSDCAPFSWGDNNRTLISAKRFLQHAINCISVNTDDIELDKTSGKIFSEGMNVDLDYCEYVGFVDTLTSLGDTYIDLES